MRLIDGDVSIDRIVQMRPTSPKQSDYLHGIDVGLAMAMVAIKDQPTIEPERKTGKWLNINESEKWECSECNRMMWFSLRLGVKPSDYKFCPNCGADMRKPEDIPVEYFESGGR